MNLKKKLHIKTYGCQMNVYDSERMAEILEPLGYEASETADDADLILLNTCHIREKATEKVFSDLGRIRPFKKAAEKDGRHMMIAVTGCTAQAEGDLILRRAPYVDMVIGPQSYHELPQIIALAQRKIDGKADAPGRGIVATDFPQDSKFSYLPDQKASGPTAFVAIQEGCDKFCHFCIVPYTRGAEYSRPLTEVKKDVESLVMQGVKEVTLLGQNVNAYHGIDAWGNETSLGQLLMELSKIEGLLRLRYITSHPNDVDDYLIDAHRDLPKVMPFLHLPIQSGSDRILKAMNRKHDVKKYLNIIDKFKKARPDMAFSSDFIVGYPGETDDDFKQSLAIINTVGYSQAYSFVYSPRPGTPAANYDNQVPFEVAKDRLQILQDCLKSHQLAFNESMNGKLMQVLVEKHGRHDGQLIGRSPYLQSVYFEKPHHSDSVAHAKVHIGSMVNLKIIDTQLNSLRGELYLDGGIDA